MYFLTEVEFGICFYETLKKNSVNIHMFWCEEQQERRIRSRVCYVDFYLSNSNARKSGSGCY